MRTVFFLICLLFLSACDRSSENERKPNILFVISDDQSFPHTSYEGSPFVNTPVFDRLANEGVYFLNMIAGSPGCAPSRSALITGRHHWQNGEAGQHAASWFKEYHSFVDELEINGYATGRTGKGVIPFQYAINDDDTMRRKTDAAGVNHSNFKYDNEYDPRPYTGIRNNNYVKDFEYFLDSVDTDDSPFFFWFGSYEPHRAYEKDGWKRSRKDIDDVIVPSFYPPSETIKKDLLDYSLEIEWFDLQLGYIIDKLKESNELDNTIIIVTSDNGMPFPRAKSNAYEYGIHVPFVVWFPGRFPGNRKVKDLIGFKDISPTLLEIAGITPQKMLPIRGKSFLNILESDKTGLVDTTRKFAFAGRERHSASRYNNLGYPQRAIRSDQYLLIWNPEYERWPAGAPQRYSPKDSTILYPMYGLDKKGKYINDGAFSDVDDSPTKAYLIENHDSPEVAYYFELAFGKRPEFELFDIQKDPENLNNLAKNPDYSSIFEKLRYELMNELKQTEDPRVTGTNPDIFESYPRYSRMRYFPKLSHHN